MEVLFVTFLIIFVSSIIFPAYIMCSSWTTAIIAAIAMSLAEVAIGIIIAIVFGATLGVFIKSRLRLLSLICSLLFIIVAILGSYFALLVAEHFVTGFAISGAIPRLALSFVIGANAGAMNVHEPRR